MYTASGSPVKQEIVLDQYADLVKKIAHQIKTKLPASVDVNDLIQAGMIGLMDAASRYKNDQGAQFTTYATLRIHGAIMDELRSTDWMPRSVRKKMRDIERAVQRLEQKFGRAPTESEIALSLKITLADLHEILNDCSGHQLIYFEDFQENENGQHFLDRHIQDEMNDPLNILLSDGFKTDLKRSIENLPEREQLLMSLYYEQNLNLKEIGAILSISESRVSQIHTQSIARIRASLKEKLWTGQA